METKNPRYDNDYVTLAFLKEYLGEDKNTDEIVKYSKNYGSQPTPPYNKNDTWTNENGLYVCVNPRSIGGYDPNDWQLIVDTKTINNYIITDELSLQDLLNRSETGKIVTYVQLTDPSTDWDTSLAKDNHVYCMWKMLEDATSYIYIKLPTDPIAYTWSEIPDTVSEIWNLSGTKTIHGSKPQTYTAGDLWIIEEDATSIPEGCSPGDWVYAINSNTVYTSTDWSKDSTVISQDSLNSFTYDKTPELIDGLKYELSTNGRVVINGGNISAGSIQSNNYIPNVRGTKIQLSDGTIDTKNFKVSSDGTITATNGNFSGNITGSTITGTTINTTQDATVGNNLYIGADQSSSSASRKYLYFTNKSYFDRFRISANTEKLYLYSQFLDLISSEELTIKANRICLWDLNNDGVELINSSDPSMKVYDGTRLVKSTYGTIRDLQYENDGQSSYMVVVRDNGVRQGVSWWDSDEKLKKNITDTKINALDVIKKIKHREYDRTDTAEHNKLGYVAQELQKIDDGFVFGVKQSDDSEILNINPSKIIPYLTKAIQEQQDMIEKLQDEVQNLKKEVKLCSK